MANYNYGDIEKYQGGVEDRIRSDFERSRYHDLDESYSVDMEHDEWWVTELGTGRQWAAVPTSFGWDFEEVSSGDYCF